MRVNERLTPNTKFKLLWEWVTSRALARDAGQTRLNE